MANLIVERYKNPKNCYISGNSDDCPLCQENRTVEAIWNEILQAETTGERRKELLSEIKKITGV